MYSAKKKEIFEKIYLEFLKNYSESQSSGDLDMELFVNEIIEQGVDKLINCNVGILPHITLFKDYTEIFNWEYIHNMYFVCIGKKKSNKIIDKCLVSRQIFSKCDNTVTKFKNTGGIENLLGGGGIENLLGGSGGLGDLISNISKNVEETLAGEDLSKIDPSQLMNSLLSGKTNINGIDFSKIINSASTLMSKKVNDGEIDISELGEKANDALKNLNLM